MRLIDADAFRDYVLGGKPIGLTICQYSESDILYMIREQPTIAQPPNPSLTLEELREMDRDWLWIELLVPICRMDSGYYIKQSKFSNKDKFCIGYPGVTMGDLPYSGYGNTWLAYRRKPEEGTT